MKNHTLLSLLCLLSCTHTSPAVDLTDATIEFTTLDETTTTLDDATTTLDDATNSTTDFTPTTTTTPDPLTTTTTDDTTSTTTDPDDTTEQPPSCGDAHVDPGEECDHGPGNGNSNSCTALCQYARCGDLLVEIGLEECDAGPHNKEDTYNECGPDCTFGPHCGDGIVDADHFEECDLGPRNGSGDADANGVPCSQQCDLEANIVFLSSLTYQPDELGSAALADLRCQHLALYGNLPNADNFHAWISDDASTPLDRLGEPVPGYPYALVTGQRVAVDRDALLTTGPELGITRTELGDPIFDAPVWTDTAPDGQQFAPQQDCSNWDSDSPQHQARVGRSGVADPEQFPQWLTGHQWTSHITLTCAAAYRLYCFEG